MTGRVNEKLEEDMNGMPLQREELSRGLGLLRACIVLFVLNWVAWICFTSIFLASRVNTGAWSLIQGTGCAYSAFALATVILLSLAIKRCVRSSGLSPLVFSALLVRIALLAWLFWSMLHLLSGLTAFVGAYPLVLSMFRGKYEHLIFAPFVWRIVGFLFVIGSIALARNLNARCGNRLLSIREFRLLAACGMLIWLEWLVHTEVVSLLLSILMGGKIFGMFWTTKIGSLLLRGFGAFWIWRALGRAQKLLNAEIICPNCNYDLSGNVSGTCPECGDKTSDPLPAQAGPLAG